MGTFKSQAQDPAIPEAQANYSLSGATIVAPEHNVFWDCFEGTTLDTGKWGTSTASGGSVTQSSGVIIASSTGSSGSASMTSVAVPSLLPDAELIVRCHAKFSAAIADNERAIEFQVDADNKASFIHVDGDWFWRLYANSAEVGYYAISAVLTNWNDFEMRLTPTRVYGKVNGVNVGSFATQGTSGSAFWSTGILGQVVIRNTNSGSTTDNTITVKSLSVTRRHFSLPGPMRAKKMTADGIVSRGPSWYFGCRRIGTTTGTLKVYHGTSAGTDPADIIDEFDADGMGGFLPQPIECYDGIYVDHDTDNVLIYYMD